MIIRMPDDKNWMEKRKIFYSMGINLFSYLRAAIENKVELKFHELYGKLETWKAFAQSIETDNGQEFNRWQIMVSLLWCAQQALGESTFESGHNEVNIPEFIGGNPAWAKDCIRLMGNEDISIYSLDVPIAVSNPRTGIGYVFFLRLDVLAPGTGELFHHPMDVLMTLPSRDFKASMGNAWESARKLIDDEANGQYDARWRILDSYRKPILETIDGRSASGAAARGLFYALHKEAINQGVVVLAQVDKDGMLNDVAGIREKVRAIGAYDTLNTIIVAGEDKKGHVQNAIRESGNGNIAVLSVEPGMKSFERLIREGETIISVRIDKYYPSKHIQVEVNEPIQIYMEITNTGNVDWPFIAMVDLWDSAGSVVVYPHKEVLVKAGQQAAVELSCLVRIPGDYWLQYTVWKMKPYDKLANRLTRAPIPAQHLITAISP